MSEIENVVNTAALLITGGLLVLLGVLVGDSIRLYHENKNKIDFKKRGRK